MAEEAECNKVTNINIRRNLRQFGSVCAPLTRIGRKSTVTLVMIDMLCDYLLENRACTSIRWLSSSRMSFVG